MALDFLAGCMGGCAGVLVGYPFDTVKVHLQTQDAHKPTYRGTFHCLQTIVARDSIKGLYRGMSSPMAGVAVVNAIVFGVYGNVQRNTSDLSSLQSHFLAGSAAGLIQSLVCSPMELIKTRLQLQENYKGVAKFQGPFQCLEHIRRTEGFRGIFRGLGITAARDVPGFSSYFVSYELMTQYTPNPTAFHTLMAGGLAGTISWILTFPIDVIKSRLQADGMSGKPKYNGILDCMNKSYQSEGLSFYTRGLASTLYRAFPTNAACFFVVSWVMKMAEKVQLDIEIHTNEPISLIGSTSTPITHPGFHLSQHSHENNESQRRRSHVIKSLITLGALSDAVCNSEIIELANSLYDDVYHYPSLESGYPALTKLDDEPILFLNY